MKFMIDEILLDAILAYSRSIRANLNWSKRNGTERSNPKPLSGCHVRYTDLSTFRQTNTTRIILGGSIVPIELEKSFEMNAIKRDATTTGRQWPGRTVSRITVKDLDRARRSFTAKRIHTKRGRYTVSIPADSTEVCESIGVSPISPAADERGNCEDHVVVL